jgi:hypothetical protein
MKIWIGAVPAMLMAGQAYAADVATCKMSPDRKTVTVVATNPYSQVMACEVNCDVSPPHGLATVVCVKPVPVGAKDFVMCTETATEGQPWGPVKGATVNCPDPAAPPKSSKTEGGKAEAGKDEDDDDAKIDEQMQKMMKQGQEMLERMKKKQAP